LRVPSPFEFLMLRNTKNPLRRGHFRGYATSAHLNPVNDRG